MTAEKDDGYTYRPVSMREVLAAIEALRAEVAEWKHSASVQAELRKEAEARADNLATALRNCRILAHNCYPEELPSAIITTASKAVAEYDMLRRLRRKSNELQRKQGVRAEVELLLIRGLPGSGKTTMAKEYAKAGYVHCEADQYFEFNGEYRFASNKLRAAHDDCLRRAITAMDAGRSVVVANTFTRRWEMEPYLKAAKKRGVNTRIIETTGNWPNVHGVPADAIERMRARWEPIET